MAAPVQMYMPSCHHHVRLTWLKVSGCNVQPQNQEGGSGRCGGPARYCGTWKAHRWCLESGAT
ncbi:hypothetical protein HaLaN_03115 [Haematococcus lacustris]|uniref:Uncharacterized protein n=1 Tax=Haematococcus lacustris TaxID=44745 RepID=A0A699YYM9_HAELA|nr:hypothetical protein HaLaN_03115 [Haematococcus lacustris]